MKDPKIIFFTLVLLLVAGFGIYILVTAKSQSDSMMEKEVTTMQKESVGMEQVETSKESMMQDKTTGAMMDKADEKMMESAMPSYVEYSNAILEQMTAKRRVLFFYASWCPTCRPVDAELTANIDKLPSDLSVIRVNYNDPDTDREEKALAQKYGVTYQHTFIQIDAQGNEVIKWNGGGLTEILEKIK